MMKHFIAVMIALVTGLGLAGCGSRGETVGTVGGAAGGAAVGNAVTGGSTLGTLGGAAVGGYIGNQVGEDYDRRRGR